MQDKDYARYDLRQDGIKVASAEGPREQAYREILHYHAVYSQDGPCKIIRRT